MARLESEQRRKILEAAVRAFAEHGRRGATTRLVGRHAGVNSALIYYYFENKDTLFAEAIRFVLGGLLERMQAARRPFTDAHDRLGWLIDQLFGYYTAHPERMRLMAIALSLHPELFGKTLAGFLPGQTLVPIEVLAEGIQRGELRKAHPMTIWWSIMGLCLFSLLLNPALPHFRPRGFPMPPMDPPARREQILALLLNGLALSAKGDKEP
jgi:TetR/AcrR family transcriptional regulator